MNDLEKLINLIGFEPKFMGLISLVPNIQELDNSEVLKTLISNKIIEVFDLENKPYDIVNIPYNITPYRHENNYYTVCIDFIEEMYKWYRFRMIHQNGEYYHQIVIEEINSKTDRIIDNTEKLEKLKKLYKKYAKKLQSELATSFYYIYNSGLEIDPEHFSNFIKKELGEDIELIIIYLTKAIPDFDIGEIPYGDDTSYEKEHFILNSWWGILEYDKVLGHIRNKLNKYSNQKELKLSYKKSELTLNQSLILLDKIRNIPIDTWENIDYTKKARLIEKLVNKSADNIRKKLPLLDKKESSLPKQFKDDQKHIELLIKQLIK